MGVLRWLAENWFMLVNAVGVVGGLVFTGLSARAAAKTRRISNLLTLTQNHREVWMEFYRNPELSRVLDPSVDIQHEPMSRQEQMFVNLVIQHLSSAYHAMKDALVLKPDGLRKDIRWFLSLPIPKAVWEKMKSLQNDDFVAFVERYRS